MYILMAAKRNEKKLVDFVYSDLSNFLSSILKSFFFYQNRAENILYLNLFNKCEGIRAEKLKRTPRIEPF